MQEHYDNVRDGNTDRYTGRFDFVKLVWKRSCSSRAEAMSKERYLKNLSHSEKRKIIG